jgi:hypothetical protein
MRENRTSGSMSGEWKRSKGQRAQATAPLLDSTHDHYADVNRCNTRVGHPCDG